MVKAVAYNLAFWHSLVNRVDHNAGLRLTAKSDALVERLTQCPGGAAACQAVGRVAKAVVKPQRFVVGGCGDTKSRQLLYSTVGAEPGQDATSESSRSPFGDGQSLLDPGWE